jgi:hypothetical protein
MLQIGKDFAADKPKILFTGGLHAREWISPTYVYLVAEWLVDNYGSNPHATDVVDNFHLFLMPMCNPDGHEYSVTTDRMWRKNSPAGDPDFREKPWRPASGAQSGAPESVDLNRNFNSKHRAAVIATGRGSWSDKLTDDTFLGSSAASAFETKALEALMTKHAFDVVCDHHSYGCFILHSPGDDTKPLAKVDKTAATRYSTFGAHMKDLLDDKAKTNKTVRAIPDTWTLSQASLFYKTLRGVAAEDSVVPGSIKDFGFYLARPAATHRALCFTLELPPVHFAGSPGFELPDSRIRAVFRMCLGNSLALIKHARVASPTAAQYGAFSAVP